MANYAYPMGNPFSLKKTASSGTDPEFDRGTVNSALKPYGVALPSSYEELGPAENTGWGQDHPRLSRGIDNALIAVAGMGPTGDTAGENISNVARGVMGIQPARQAFHDQQTQAPFQYAKEVGGLQAQQAYMHMQEAQAKWYGDRATLAYDTNAQKYQNAQMRNVLLAGKEMQILHRADGSEYVGAPDIDESGNLTYQETQVDPASFKAQTFRNKQASRFGSGFAGGLFADYLARPVEQGGYGSHDKIPDSLSKADIEYGIDLANRVSGNYARLGSKADEDRFNAYRKIDVDLFHKSLPKLELTKDEAKRIDDQARAAWLADPANANNRGYLATRAAGAKAVADEIARRQNDYDAKVREFGEYATSLTPEQQMTTGFDTWRKQRTATTTSPVLGGPAPDTQVHDGFEYTRGADGLWHKGNPVRK